MRICIDLDGTICKNKLPGQSYADLEPIPGAVEALKKLKEQGHYIIISTARHMKTCNNNVGLVVAKQGKTLLDWLEKYKIKYDEIHFGKILATVYIDDHAIKFKNWDHTIEELLQVEDHLK